MQSKDPHTPPATAQAQAPPPFPYKRTFITETPKSMLNNLCCDEVFTTLIEAVRDDTHVLPVRLLTTGAAYRAVNRLTDLFTEEARVKAKLHGQLSPWEYWQLHHATVNERAKKDFADTVNSTDHYALRLTLSQMCKEATLFGPVLSRQVYDLLLPEAGGRVLDPFSGWGDRALGALGSRKVWSYDGVDCNSALIPGYQRLVDELDTPGHKLRFHLTPWQRFAPPHAAYDLVFTSPPYYDFEIYSPEPTQSITGQATYHDWWQRFMTQALRKMRALVKPSGYLALHLGHTFRTPTFIDDVHQFCVQSLGLRFVQSVECLTFSKLRTQPKRPIALYVFQAPSTSPPSPGSTTPASATAPTAVAAAAAVPDVTDVTDAFTSAAKRPRVA